MTEVTYGKTLIHRNGTDEWQSFKTAPKDGKVFRATGIHGEAICYWLKPRLRFDIGKWIFVQGETRWWEDDSHALSMGWKWRPLEEDQNG